MRSIAIAIILVLTSTLSLAEVDIEFKSYKEALKELKARGVQLEVEEGWLIGQEELESSGIVWMFAGDKKSPVYKSFAKILIHAQEGKVVSEFAVSCTNKKYCEQFTSEISEISAGFIQ